MSVYASVTDARGAAPTCFVGVGDAPVTYETRPMSGVVIELRPPRAPPRRRGVFERWCECWRRTDEY